MAREETGSVWTAEKQLALAAALYVLSSTERVVAEMYYGGLLDVPHIANALRTTSGTIEGYLTRIRRKWDKLRAGIG
jgi:DNA-directed RNA polymerase specialized sigma24 family protein